MALLSWMGTYGPEPLESVTSRSCSIWSHCGANSSIASALTMKLHGPPRTDATKVASGSSVVKEIVAGSLAVIVAARAISSRR